MMKWVWVILVIMCTPVWAATLKLETERGRIFVPEQKGWELGKDMFGMPFIYFSPQTNGQRSNISFTTTGLDVEFNLAVMNKDKAGHQKLKREWAAEVLATPTGFIPYKRWANAQGHTIHEIGFEYDHEGKHYVEKSFYIDCRGRLIYAKSLRLKDNAAHDKEFTTLVKEMDCGV